MAPSVDGHAVILTLDEGRLRAVDVWLSPGGGATALAFADHVMKCVRRLAFRNDEDLRSM